MWAGERVSGWAYGALGGACVSAATNHSTGRDGASYMYV